MEDVTYTVKDSDSYGPDEKPTFIAEDGFTREEMRIYDCAVTVLDRQPDFSRARMFQTRGRASGITQSTQPRTSRMIDQRGCRVSVD